MELDRIVFTTDTSELSKATDAIGTLVQEMSKISTASANMAKVHAQTEAILARAASSYADARKKNAEAADKELRSAIAADKADQQREKSTKKATEAVDKSTGATQKNSEAVSNNTTVLQRQSDILEFMAQGWSKGQAGILATAKAAKTAAEDMQSLMDVMDKQRKFMGTDPFDNSRQGLKSLQDQYAQATEAMKQYEAGTGLTAKQTRELARDKERLSTAMQMEGKSFEQIDAAIKKHNQEYITLANQYNAIIRAEDAVMKQRREMVSASNYVIQAEEKMKAALDATNSSLNKAATDDLVKYENALRKSGMSQDLMTEKLATYKNQLAQVQIQEQKRAADHLARSLSPQLTDIGVSLWSGQSPLTVLIQQGGQMMDLFRMSGVAAQDFGKVMRESFNSMLPAMATVAKGLGSFVIGSLMDAGKAATDFVAKVTGISAAMEMVKRSIASGGEENFKYIASLQRLGSVLAGVAGAGFAALIAGAVGLAVGLKQVITEENALAKVLALSGGSLAVSHTNAIQYAKSMNDAGVSTGKAMLAITEMAKAGNFAASEIPMVTKAAVDMEKYAGIAIKDTIEAFSKLKEKPVEAMIELAKTTGMVAPEVLKAVIELEKQGKTAEAVALAMQTLGSVNSQQVDKMKQDYNGFSLFVMDLGKSISNFFSNVFKSLFYKTPITDALDSQLKEVRSRIKDTESNLGTLGKLGITPDNKLLNSLKEQERMIISQIGATVRLAGEEERRVKTNTENAKAIESTLDLHKKYDGTITTAQKEITKLQQHRTDLQAKGLLTAEREAIIAKGIAAENKKIADELKKDKPKGGDSYFATTMKKFRDEAIEASTATDNLTKSQEELLKVTSDPKFLALSKARQNEILQLAAQTIAVEQLERARIQEGKAEEFRQKVLGKSEGLGKQYYEDIDKLLAFRDAGKFTQEQTEELTRAIYESTPVWKKYAKDVEEAQKALNKYNEESIASQADSSKENLNLDLRLSLLGKTAEQQKILQREHERSIKLSEVDLELTKKKREVQASIDRATKDKLPESSEEYKGLIAAREQLEVDAAEKRKVINRDVAVQYAEDMQREFDRISGGITDSIVTALFEGGKAGAASIRSLIVNELKKPVTLVVQAVVNAVLGNVIGGLVGGAGGSAAGGIASSIGSSAVGGLASNALGTLGAFGGAVQGFGTAALAATQSMIGMTGTVAQMSTSLAAAGHTAAAGMQSGIAAFQAIPGWGWALAGIGLLAGMMDFGGEQRFGGGYQLNGNKEVKYTAGPGGGQINQRAQEAIVNETYKSVNSILKSLGSTLEVIDFYAGLETSGKGKGGTFAGGKLSSGAEFGKKWQAGMYSQDLTAEEAVKQFAGQMKIVTVEALKAATDIPMYLQDELKKVDVAKLTGDTAGLVLEETNRMYTLFSTVKGALELLNKPMFDTTTAGYALTETFVEMFGGMEGLKTSVSSYYDNFYSEAEKELNIRNQLTAALSEQNLTLPKTREEYRNLVEAQDLTTEAGRANYAVLLKNAGAFAELTPAASAANKQIAGLNKMFAGLGVNTKLAETKFDKATKEMFESLGVDVEQYAGSIGDVISGILTGDTKIEDAGKELTNAFVGGINSAIAKAGSDAIAAQFVATVITPILDNIRNGKEALEGVDLESAVSKARQDSLDLMFVLNTIGDELGEGVKDFVSNIVGASKNATTDINVNTQKDIARTVVQDYRNLINDSLSTVRQQITDARSKLKELESEADWVRGEAGMNFGQTGATPADTFSAKIFSSYDAYASNMAALAKQYEGMTEAQKGVLAELESEETRYLGTIERLDAILSEGKSQLKQMMSVEDAIGILEGSVVSAISTVVDAVGNIKITSPSGSGGGSNGGGGSGGGGGGLFSGVQGGGGGGELGTNPWNTQYGSWGEVFNAITGAVTGETTTSTQFSGVQGLIKSKSALLKPEKNALFAGVQSDGDTPVLTEPSPSTSILTIDPATGLPIGLLSPDYVPATTDPIQTFNGISIDDLPNGYYYDPKDGMIHVPWGTYLPGLLAPGYVMDAPVIDPNSGGSSGVFSGVQGGGSYGGGGTGGGTQTGTTGTGIPTGTGTGTTPTTTASTTLTIADYKQMAQLQNQYWKLMEDEESIRAAILAPMKDEVKVMQTLVWAAEDFADGLQNIDADTPLTTLKNTIATFITALGDDVEGIEKATAKGNNVLNETRKSLYEQLIPEDELEAVNLAKVTQDFKDLGYALPSSADAFRNLIDSLEDGALKDKLLELIPAFNKIPNALQTFTEAYETQLGRAPDTAGLEYWTEQVNNGTLTQEQALKAFSESATTEGLNNRILELTDAEGYLSLMRKNELSLLSPTNQVLKERIYALEDEAKALQFLAEITRTRVDADIKLLQTQGNTTEAEKLQREQFIAGLTGLTAAQKEAKIAAYDYSTAIEKQVKVLQERVGLENRLNQLLGNTSLIRAQELEKLDASNRALQERIWGIEDADKAVSSALSAVERAIGAEKDRIQKETDAQILAIRQGIDGSKESLDNAQKQVDLLTGIFDKITDAVKTLRGSVDEERKMLDARGYIDASIALAKTGVIPDSEKLSEALGVVTSNQTSGYSTRNDFIREQQIQANKLEELASILGVQKTTEEQQLDTLKNANKLAEEQIAAIENAREQQLEALDMQLLKAKEQVDVMRGVDISIKSVGTSIDALSAAIAEYQQIIAGAITTSQSISANQPPKTGVFNPITAEPIEWTSGSDSWNAGGSNVQFGSGFSIGFDSSLSKEQIADVLQSNIAEAQRLYESGWSQDKGAYGAKEEITEWARDNNIPGFAVGTNYVPEDMLATIHKGEMIVPKKFNPATSGIQQDNSELVTELKALRTEVQMLRAEARATAVNTSKTARILDDVTQGGDTLKTEVAA